MLALKVTFSCKVYFFSNSNVIFLPARAPVALLITVKINAVPARGRWQILPNVTIPF